MYPGPELNTLGLNAELKMRKTKGEENFYFFLLPERDWLVVINPKLFEIAFVSFKPASFVS